MTMTLNQSNILRIYNMFVDFFILFFIFILLKHNFKVVSTISDGSRIK